MIVISSKQVGRRTVEAPCSKLQGIFDPQGSNYLF
jgi:hypothetical protein